MTTRGPKKKKDITMPRSSPTADDKNTFCIKNIFFRETEYPTYLSLISIHCPLCSGDGLARTRGRADTRIRSSNGSITYSVGFSVSAPYGDYRAKGR